MGVHDGPSHLHIMYYPVQTLCHCTPSVIKFSMKTFGTSSTSNIRNNIGFTQTFLLSKLTLNFEQLNFFANTLL